MKTWLLKDPQHCNNFFSQTIGCMFRKNISRPFIFIFNRPRYISLHSWFVFEPIIAYYLDQKKKIICSKLLRPFSIKRPVKCSYIVELPKKDTQTCEIKSGDRFSW